MQPPFAARIDESANAQGLQDQIPARPFAAGRQARGKESIQFELLIEMAGQPAGAPLPARPFSCLRLSRAPPPRGAAQFHLREPNADDVLVVRLMLFFESRGVELLLGEQR